MADIGFKRLSRGVKLLVDHIYTPIQKSLTRFTTTGLDDSNMESGNSRCRVSFPWAGLKPKRGAAATTDRRFVQAAFTLPPPQEMFRANGVNQPQDISYVLDSVALSFDQRAEAAAINEDGSLNFTDKDKVSFTVNRYSKTPNVFQSTSTSYPDNQLMSVAFDSLKFTNQDFVENPSMKSGLGLSLDPYQVLMLEVDLSSFQDASQDLIIDSLVVSLDFYAPLMQRDKATVSDFEVQNIPSSHKGARSIASITTTPPAAGAVITADTSPAGDGVEVAMKKIDEVFHKRLRGGYGQKSRDIYKSNILNDAGYEVIAVPMWGNGWYCRGAVPAGDDSPFLPLVGADPYSAATCDRRIVPLQFPMVIHHVFACANVGAVPPTSATLTNQIGVGLGCGIRSDLFESRQVAFASWTVATQPQFLIDKSQVRTEHMQLYNIPLVYTGANTGTGYNPTVASALSNTGTPVFAGQALSTEKARTALASSVGAVLPFAPLMQGQDQYLEIRWEIRDSGGIKNMPANEGVIGFAGHWVYIVGKKHLC